MTDRARVIASPYARKLAREKGLELGRLEGSGPNGRIIKRDILAEHANPSLSLRKPVPREIVPHEPAPKSAAQGFGKQGGAIFSPEALAKIYEDAKTTRIELSKMRQTIATRLVQAKQLIPHFYLRREACLDGLLKIRAEIKPALEARGVKISINDFIIKAVGQALKETPKANAIWAEDHILELGRCDVCVAVAVEDGLYTPLIRGVEDKSLSEISREMKALAERARKGALSPHEYQGGSITISNLGMYGVENFDAIINPPQSAILAVGAGRPQARYDEAEKTFTKAMMVSLTLACDHRVIDGARGAELLERIVAFIENPVNALI